MSTEIYDFALRVVNKDEDWNVMIYVGGEFRAGTHSPDLDASLRMAVPYLASYCSPDPFAAFIREPPDHVRGGETNT